MAASVRIEDEAFSDHRYGHLAKLLGLPNASCARGMMADVWRQCTAQQKHVLSAALVDTILGDGGAKFIVEADLGEVADGGIRIKGTRTRIEWLGKLRKNAKKGGKAKAAKRLPNGSDKQAQSSAPLCPPAPAPAPAPAQKAEAAPEISDPPAPATGIEVGGAAAGEIKTLGQLKELFERRGWQVGGHPGRVQRERFSGLVAASVISAQEVEDAAAAFTRKPKSADPWAWFLGCVERDRNAGAEEAARPKPSRPQQRAGPKPVNGSGRKASEVLAGMPAERDAGGLESTRAIIASLGPKAAQ